MTARVTTDAGRLVYRITPRVTVRWDNDLNMIEVLEGRKVVVCGIAERNYTLNQFYDYLLHVQEVYK